jgi:mRNA interferase RelE/StbE
VYKVLYLASVENDLAALDKPVRKRVMDKIEKTLAQDPRGLGKALSGPFAGLWRYRIGDYRVIYKIAEEEILILIARIGHRRDIYRRIAN